MGCDWRRGGVYGVCGGFDFAGEAIAVNDRGGVKQRFFNEAARWHLHSFLKNMRWLGLGSSG